MSKDSKKETRKLTHNLKVPLTADEIKQAADDMEKSIAKIDLLEDEIKSIKSNFKSQIDAESANIRCASNLYRNKYEFRLVECIETRDYASGRLTETRLDTGETFTDRKLRPSETQQSLDFEQRGGG